MLILICISFLFLSSVSSNQNQTDSQKVILETTVKPELTTNNQSNESTTKIKELNLNETIANESLAEPELAARKSLDAPLLLLQTLKGLGERCNSKQDCRVEHSACSNNTCICEIDYIKAPSGKSCLRIAHKMGDVCSENTQCMEGLNKIHGETMCLNYKCSCRVGHRMMDGKCVGQMVLSTACERNSDCDIQGSACEENICVCTEGHLPHPDDTTCLPAAKNLNDPCLEDAQCHSLTNALCKNGHCLCNNLYRFNGTNCVPVKALGDDCESNKDCEVPEEPGRRGCVNRICSCIKGVREDDLCKSGARSLTAGLGLLFLSVKLTFFNS